MNYTFVKVVLEVSQEKEHLSNTRNSEIQLQKESSDYLF